MGFLKKIIMYFKYLKLIKLKKKYLYSKFNLRIDYLGRLYTVYYIPEKERYFGFETDYIKGKIFKYLKPIEDELINLGILDIVSLTITPLEGDNLIPLNNDLSIPLMNHNFLIVFEFSPLKIKKIIKNSIIFLLGVVTFLILFL